jgi:hypothetical protein
MGMATKPAKSPGRVVKLTKPKLPEPPRPLGDVGLALWREVTRNYMFADPASIECLFQACSATDRAERCRVIIDQDGEMIAAKEGVRSHPLLRDELANRAFAVRALSQLGLDLEPVKAMGRPPGLSFA